MTDEEKQAFPGHYVGYPGLCEWMSLSEDFFLLQRFSPLAARCLLSLQHDIAQIKNKLDEIDTASMQQPPGRGGGCGSFTYETQPKRTALIEDATVLLQKYCICYPIV
jgi:hypothetical protein